MNFFSHAYLAARETEHPGVIFGSMLPDFCSMIGTRPFEVEAAEIRRGVDHHHQVDRAFHGAPIFLALMGHGQDVLESLGVRAAPAMALAHVGVELVLDGWLTSNGHDPGRFVDAVTFGHRHVTWPSDVLAQRWRLLHRRLLDGALPGAYRDARFVASRLAMVLSARPRLAIRDGEPAAVEQWLTTAIEEIPTRGPELMREVTARLRERRQAAPTEP